jgi:glycosyltransferase involved in cell wall biosynthesis
MTSSLVSIIMPTHNSYEYTRLAIISVLGQSYNNWELLITDDCSTDNSYINLRNEFNDERIKFFQLSKNSGPAVARNNSIKYANGKFIAFLDGDDKWDENKLVEQVGLMESNNYAFTFSSYNIIDDKENVRGEVLAEGPVDYRIMLRNNYIGCLTAVYNAEMLGKIDMPLIRKRQDWALWLKLLKLTDFAYPINKKLAYYRVTPQSVSSNKIDLLKYTWKIYRNVEKLNLFKSTYHFVMFFYFYILKKYL